ncbi:MAG TPA: VIT domain-containing protein [Pontiellaceae bacterium]|nr:VIT domain-containing protein [Pontiellaceae bacterium]
MKTKYILCVAALIAAATASGTGLLKPVGALDSGASIKSHQVEVVINNGFAQTTIDQVFANSEDKDFEAIYSFPLPKEASLSELSLWIDGKEVVGEVLEKEKARKAYEKQVAQGKETALAEKNDFKTFDISVGRIKAGQDTRIRIVYYQPVRIDLNIGRYVYPLAEGGVDDERIAFWETDNRVKEQFSFKLKLKSAFPLKDVRMPGYDQTAQINKTGTNENQTVYDILIESPEGGATLSRDIICYYRLDDTVPARVELIPYRASPKNTGTFMAVITPAADLKPITEGTDWIFVLDRSGSMSGEKIQTLVKGVGKVLGKMSPKDRFKIVTFNNNAQNFSGGYISAAPENVQSWIEKVQRIQAEGSTALYDGLKEAYNGLDADRTTGIILVTDGVCNVGPTGHKTFLNLLHQYDIRLFTFVIGNSANQPLMDRLANDSGGFAMNISDSDDIIGRLLQAKIQVMNECMHDVELKFGGEKVHHLTPVAASTLFMGQQLVVFGRYDGSGPVDLKLTAKISGQPHEWNGSAVLPATDTANPELERLWALSSIDEIMEKVREDGEAKPLRERIVALGTEYSLVTDYTSMIVLDDEAIENEGISRRNLQRVQTERSAQQQRAAAPVQNYRADNGNTFQNRLAPGIGTGPVGPLFIGLIAWLNRRKKIAA